MKFYECPVGMSIEQAATLLVKRAPAYTNFNGVKIRARYATTNPRDIVVRYHYLLWEKDVAYDVSPAGKAWAAQMEARRVEYQMRTDALLAGLDAIPEWNARNVLAWVEAFAECSRINGVAFDAPRLVERFAEHGWYPMENCGEDFHEDDADNHAHWIVGQVLFGWRLKKMAMDHDDIGRFSNAWRKKFGVPRVTLREDNAVAA